MDRKKAVIIGGSFAGLSAAKQLARYNIDVCVIDAYSEFVWTPNIHEIVSGVKRARDVTLSRPRLLRSLGHRFMAGRVIELDLEQQTVQLNNGRSVAFDTCLVACGHASAYLGSMLSGSLSADNDSLDNGQFEQIGQHGFRQPTGIVGIHEAIRQRLASQSTVSVTIAGGGFSGVEALGELLRSYRDEPRVSVNLVERSPRLVKGLPAVVSEDIQRLTAELPVAYHFGCSITEITGNQLTLSDGSVLETDEIIWTVGTELPAFIRQSALWADESSGILVDKTLQHPQYPSIFVAGDAAIPGEPVVKQSYHALDMGVVAGENMVRWLNQEPVRTFEPLNKPLLLAFGDLNTYLVAGDTVVASPLLATMKEGLYQFYMAKLSAPMPLIDVGYGAVERFCTSVSSLLVPEIRHPRPLELLRHSRILQYGDSQDLLDLLTATRVTLFSG